jgi:octaprenyl-diphosphate synthase
MFNYIILDVLSKKELYAKELEKSAQYITTQYGKRIRSVLYYMCGNRTSYDDPKYHRTIAIIEDVHSATLMHDDVIDNNAVRRNGRSQYAEHGAKLSILLGDRALIGSIGNFMRLHDNSPYIRRFFIRECEATAYGAILEQGMNCCKSPSMDNYVRMAYLKTAPFFKMCCFLGTFLVNEKFDEAKKLAIVGMCFGTIFQVQNDLNSYKEDDFRTSEDYVMKNISFPIVLMHNYLGYDINTFKNETHQAGYDAIRQEINSERFTDISCSILEKYVSRYLERIP